MDRQAKFDRRTALKCMAWAGTGLVWTVAGGVPRPLGFVGEAVAASGFTFVQISDSHIGFAKEANPDTAGTLRAALAKIDAMAVRPDLVVHTGDVTHLAKPAEFELAAQILSELKAAPIRFIPGEHDVLDDTPGALYRERFAKGTLGDGWYSFDQAGVHFVALVNVVDLQAGGFGKIGDAQLAWLADDLKARGSSTPVVVLAHMPLWTVAEDWGWGTSDAERALTLLRRFGSVTVLNGHIHQVMQKVEGHVGFHTAMSTAFPQPAPGTAASPGPMKVGAERLRQVLGIRSITVGPPTVVRDLPLADG